MILSTCWISRCCLQRESDSSSVSVSLRRRAHGHCGSHHARYRYCDDDRSCLLSRKKVLRLALLGQLGGLASLGWRRRWGAAGAFGLKNPDDLYIGLLQSEDVMDGVIRRFDLMKVYKAKRMVDARKRLKGETKIVSEKSSLINISVEDHDAKRAAAMANAYVDELHVLMSHLAVTSAAQRRIFFEQQVDQEKEKLADAEVALEKTEMKTGIIQPQGQAQAVIATIMQLRAQIAAREVELESLRTSATDQNPEVITLQSQIAGLRTQLADFEKGHPQSAEWKEMS